MPKFMVGVGILSEENCDFIFCTFCVFHHVFLVTQSCRTLCDPMASSPPASSVHGILQARILEWVANPFLEDLPNPGIEPRSPVFQADSLLSWKEPNAFVFSTLGENKTKMKKCIPHIQFCLSAHLNFTERNKSQERLSSTRGYSDATQSTVI